MRKAGALLLTLGVLMLMSIPVLATDSAPQTCKDLGYENLEADSSGVWGSVDFDNTSDTLTLVVNAGYEVTLCVKAGSTNQGNGPEVVGPFWEGTHYVGHSSGKELSHYGFTFETKGTTTTEEESSTTTVNDTTTTSEGETTTVPGSSTTTESSSTTTEGSTTTTSESSTTTTSSVTTSTTLPVTTSVPGTTLTTPPNMALWSAEGDCDTIAVEFGEGIAAVDVWHNNEVLFSFEESGERQAVVGAPFEVRLVPVPDGTSPVFPDFIDHTFEHCTPAPTTTTDPGEPIEELPFTGFTEMGIGVAAGICLVLGSILTLLSRNKEESGA